MYLVFYKNQKYHFEVLKKLKLNLYVDNVVIYNPANFQVEISYILSFTKMTKYDIYNSEECRFSNSHNLSEFIIFVQPKILGISSPNFSRM
jgi:hypothetical protein